MQQSALQKHHVEIGSFFFSAASPPSFSTPSLSYFLFWARENKKKIVSLSAEMFDFTFCVISFR